GDEGVSAMATQIVSYMAGQLPGATPALGAASDLIQYASGRNPYDAFRGRLVLTQDELDSRTESWHAFGKVMGYEFMQLGGGMVWKFYSGDERPVDKT